ncbi:MAG TPA: hypothetical protein PLR88_11560 [Bacteroidales bacterium]|nr:hypothetical protein [Bacteroidales bacterium]
MELKEFYVRELTIDEKININGGNKVGDFFAKVWNAIKEAYEWIEGKISEWALRNCKQFIEKDFQNIY